jgi:hypothetical protein
MNEPVCRNMTLALCCVHRRFIHTEPHILTGRWLFVAFTVRGNSARSVSARDMNPKDRRSTMKKSIPNLEDQDREGYFLESHGSTE